MASRKRVQNTHISERIRTLHGALLDIVGAFNRPKADQIMVREAGISLDRALFPLLVTIERRGPIGVVDLADRIGRDYTTVSRQVTKLESLKLVERHVAATDRRSSEARITAKGKEMTDAVDRARERLLATMFATWKTNDIEELVRLVRRFADAIDQGIADSASR